MKYPRKPSFQERSSQSEELYFIWITDMNEAVEQQ